MRDGHDHSVESAREAGERDQLAAWVASFLSSPGSDNAALAGQLMNPPRWWLGPVQLPLHRLHRLTGPPDAPVLCPVDEEAWRDDVDDLQQRIEGGWQPPPVIVTYRDDQLVLEDGNHRVEGLRRAGRGAVWSIVSFTTREERDAFAVPDAA